MVTITKDENDGKKVTITIDFRENKRLAENEFNHALLCLESGSPMTIVKDRDPFDILVRGCKIERNELLTEYPGRAYNYSLVLKGELI